MVKSLFYIIRRILNFLTRSLTAKLIFIILAATLVPLCISSLISYNNSIYILQDEYIKSNLKVVDQCSQNITNYFDGLNQLSLSLYSSEFMNNINFEPTDFSGNQTNEKFLKSILFSREDIVYLYYYIYKSKVLYSFSKQMYANDYFPQLEDEDWLIKTVSNPNGAYLAPEGKFINYKSIGNSDSDNVITYNRKIKDISTGNVFGVLSLVIDNKRLGELCKSITSDNEVVALANSAGEVFYYNSLKKEYIKQLIQNEQIKDKNDGYYTLTIDNIKNIVIFSKTFNGLILLKAMPYSLFENNSKKLLKTNTVIIVITFAAIMILSILISYLITLPVKHLVENMKKVGEGNFNIKASHASNDEIGQLANIFNEMTCKINFLINSEYKLKIAKKNAQLRALQAQINPHFMYNALQSIGTLAIRKEAPEIYAMANAIANMLRYSLKSSNDLVTLGTEIENMDNYLYVQKVRFGGRLNVDTNIDDGIRGFMVPRLILQPLIENSIKYGIDDEKPEESITINAKPEDGYISVTVRDTGRGIDQSRLDMLREWLEQEDDLLGDGEHLGIKNVLNRMRLIYGEKATLTIESKTGEGTGIIIKMPVNYETE